MRTKDELFRAAQREISARRQRAVMQAETERRAAFAANPALAAADDAHMRAGLSLAKAAALGGDMDTTPAALAEADKALADAVKAAGSRGRRRVLGGVGLHAGGVCVRWCAALPPPRRAGRS